MAEIIPFPQRSPAPIDGAKHEARTSRGGPRAKAKSQYDLYALPFFDKKRLSTWAIEPSGNYGEDYETGRTFAIEFLQSNDGTLGWTTLLAQIVGDMVRAGPSGAWADATPKINGVVIGFMNTLGKVLYVIGPDAGFENFGREG